MPITIITIAAIIAYMTSMGKKKPVEGVGVGVWFGVAVGTGVSVGEGVRVGDGIIKPVYRFPIS